MPAIDCVLQRIVSRTDSAAGYLRPQWFRVRVSRDCAVWNVVRIRAIARQDVDHVEIVLLRRHKQRVQRVKVSVRITDGNPEMALFADISRSDSLNIVDVNGVRVAGRPRVRGRCAMRAVEIAVRGRAIRIPRYVRAEIQRQVARESPALRHLNRGADRLVAKAGIATAR